MSLYSNTENVTPPPQEKRSEPITSLTLARYALAGGLVGVAIVGVFGPSDTTHHFVFDLVGAIVGLAAVVLTAKFMRIA